MKILLLLSEMWNDKTHPNNNMTNWFTNFDGVEIATITGGAGLPNNKCCKKYFQVTDKTMALSILKNKPAGKILEYTDFPCEDTNQMTNSENKIYNNSHKLHFETARLFRDFIWKFGKYNTKLLKQFIDDFKPDIIFSQRMGSVKMCKMERTVCSLTNVPIVAYTGDDEYSLKFLSFNPIFWIRRFWVRHELNKQIPTYKLFYGMSDIQLNEFKNKFGVKTKFLVKCGEFEKEKIHITVNKPIKLIYAGKLYCNRWKTLSLLVGCIKEINKEDKYFELNIYTGDLVTKRQNKLLNDGYNSYIIGKVTSRELVDKYNESDIALHVEGLDLHSYLSTKYSFSTKIIDCMASGCAVMAICREGQAGYNYLKKNNIAFTASNKKDILDTLNKIKEDNLLITQYSNKVYEFGVKNHERKNIQKNIMQDFVLIINK